MGIHFQGRLCEPTSTLSGIPQKQKGRHCSRKIWEHSCLKRPGEILASLQFGVSLYHCIWHIISSILFACLPIQDVCSKKAKLNHINLCILVLGTISSILQGFNKCLGLMPGFLMTFAILYFHLNKPLLRNDFYI